MVGEVDENSISRGRFKNSTGTLTSNSSSVGSQDGQEVFWGNVLTSVINLTSGININTFLLIGGLVVELSWERILGGSGYVIIREYDDVGSIETLR